MIDMDTNDEMTMTRKVKQRGERKIHGCQLHLLEGRKAIRI